MGHRALKREDRVAGTDLRGLEAQVVIAMGRLCRSSRVDDVELRRDLVGGSKPCLADKCDDFVAVIGSEDLRVPQAELFKGVPDPIVGARLCEVFAPARVARALLVYHGPELLRR